MTLGQTRLSQWLQQVLNKAHRITLRRTVYVKNTNISIIQLRKFTLTPCVRYISIYLIAVGKFQPLYLIHLNCAWGALSVSIWKATNPIVSIKTIRLNTPQVRLRKKIRPLKVTSMTTVSPIKISLNSFVYLPFHWRVKNVEVKIVKYLAAILSVFKVMREFI